MLIRVVTTRAAVPRTGEGIAFVHGEIEPKVSALAGNRGLVLAVDRRAERYVTIAAWTDVEALAASENSARGEIADVVRRLHGSEPVVEVFDLVLAHVVKPVRVGYWGRLARVEVPVEDVPRAVQRFPQVVLALFERYEGLAAVILFVDPATGVLESITWYDSLRVLRASASRTRELHDLLVADIPTMRLGEEAELEAVIVETNALSRVEGTPYTWN
jgi:hypothetical protein